MVANNSSLLALLLAMLVAPSIAGWNRNSGFMVDEVSPRWLNIKSAAAASHDNRGIRATDVSPGYQQQQQPINDAEGG